MAKRLTLEEKSHIDLMVARLEREMDEAMNEIGDVVEQVQIAYLSLKGNSYAGHFPAIVAQIVVKKLSPHLPWYVPEALVRSAIAKTIGRIIYNKKAGVD